jgi:hypothetical protein
MVATLVTRNVTAYGKNPRRNSTRTGDRWGRDLKLGPAEYKAAVLTSRPRRSVQTVFLREIQSCNFSLTNKLIL